MNKKYWKEFYNNNPDIKQNSSFSSFVLPFIQDGQTLLDLGCGTGRDTYYFLANNVQTKGIDNNPQLTEDVFIVGDVLDNVEKSDNYYLRFFVHALEEEYLDKLLEKIYEISDKGARIFIETRSVKGITEQEKMLYNFKSGIGEKHFRMLYSVDYLKRKIEEKFSIFYLNESYGLSPFLGKDPCLIRMLCEKR